MGWAVGAVKTFLARLYRCMPVHLVKIALRLTQTKFTVTVVGIFFNAHRKVLVLRHVYRHHHPWGLPAGFINAGETPEVGILRELVEETSLSARVTEILPARARGPRHLEIAVVGMIDSTQTISLNHEIFEVAFVDPLDLPRGMPPGQSDLVKRAAATITVR